MPDRVPLPVDPAERFGRLAREIGIPGVAWGVVRDGVLAASGGIGTTRDGEDRRPDADTVFRIASMTKSFTCATLLLLRDEGRLRLDDPVAAWVPALATWPLPTADSEPVTIRQLMTMSGGLPTDDPWGDRQQGLDLDRFAELLAAGPSFAFPPATTFEYSNLGYGILGRVITAAAGREYRELVADRILRPLGMDATVYLEEQVPEARLAHGYVRQGDRLVREGRDGYGALASMGGLFSTVADLARWVQGYIDAFPARDDPEGGHPLRRATRRELQQGTRPIPLRILSAAPDQEPLVLAGSYGFGLAVRLDAELGTFVSHSGGYPGFGSHMVWHPATGLGVIALGNLRYAPMSPASNDVIGALVRADAAPRRRLVALPAAIANRRVVDGLIERWDDAVADDVFAMNMDLDEPRELRRAAIAQVVAELGPFKPDDARGTDVESPAQLSWWLRGTRGWARVGLLVTPEPRPRLQRLTVRGVGDPSPAIRSLAERVLGMAARPPGAWPRDLPVTADVDRDAVLRALRVAAPRFGILRLGLPTAGDGRTTTTFDLTAERGRAELTVGLDAGGKTVTAISLAVPERESPPEAW